MKLTKSLVMATVLLWVILPPPAHPISNTEVTVADSVKIEAPPAKVWQAIQKQRHADPAHRKLISEGDSKYVLKEEFSGLPVIGTTKMVYEECETPMTRIDYKLLESDKLKCFDGAYTLNPQGEKETVLHLSSRTDTGIDMPFGKTIARSSTLKLLRKKLAAIKTTAEARAI